MKHKSQILSSYIVVVNFAKRFAASYNFFMTTTKLRHKE